MTVRRRFAPLAAALAAFVFLAPGAMAHEWFSKRTDPIMGSCCDGYDCGEFVAEPGMLTPEDDGIRVRMNRAQVLKANPQSSIESIDQVVPWSRIQESETGNWAICPKFHGAPDNAIRCFFAPPNT